MSLQILNDCGMYLQHMRRGVSVKSDLRRGLNENQWTLTSNSEEEGEQQALNLCVERKTHTSKTHLHPELKCVCVCVCVCVRC